MLIYIYSKLSPEELADENIRAILEDTVANVQKLCVQAYLLKPEESEAIIGNWEKWLITHMKAGVQIPLTEPVFRDEGPKARRFNRF